MAKTWIVARHEFSVTLGRVGYRISLGVVPVVALLTFIGIFIFQSVRSGEVSVEAGAAAAESVRVGYVDLSEGEDGGRIFTSFRQQGRTTFVPYADQETATRALLKGDIDDLYVFAPDYLRSGRVTRVEMTRSGINMDGNSSAGPLRRFVVSNLLEGRVEAELAARVAEPYRLTTVEVDEAGTEAAESELNFSRLVIFGAFGLLLTVSLFTAGGYLVQSVTEEKQNRVMEVLISSIKPDQLMFGKLLGLGAVGLLLVVVWAASGLLFLLIVGRVVDLPELDFHLLAGRADSGADVFSARLCVHRHVDGGYRRSNDEPAGGEQHHGFCRASGGFTHLVHELPDTGPGGRGCADTQLRSRLRLRSRA